MSSIEQEIQALRERLKEAKGIDSPEMTTLLERKSSLHAAQRLREITEEVARQAVAWRTVKKPLSEKEGGSALGAWFLGPKAENLERFKQLVLHVVDEHGDDRLRDYKDDPPWVTDERRKTDSFKESDELLGKQLQKLTDRLKESVPFFSYRYQGHMLWDVTLPAVLGYFAAMLYNQNNVAAEASPVTTQLEIAVGDDLCRMLGYYVPPKDFDKKKGARDAKVPEAKTRAWGHITCDGSVANTEAMWCARNLKYYPLGLAAALKNEKDLEAANGLDVRLPSGAVRTLVELSPWELLNLGADQIVALPQRLKDEYDVAHVDLILERYTLQDVGLLGFLRRFGQGTHDPAILIPATAHYSWPKSAALLGLGRGSTIPIAVDLDGRMDMRELRRALDECLRDRRPVIMAVSVLGSTQESAVDPLASMLEMRGSFRAKGLEFWIHVDAAWGGYFASMLRPAMKKLTPALRTTPGIEPGVTHALPAVSTPLMALSFAKEEVGADTNERFFGPAIAMNAYVNAQYEVLGEADSITVDPHKAGYIPYPAGGLCYRNSAMRHLVAFSAPVVYKGGADPTVGVFGVEGSKPGAAAAATYLSHRVIRTDQSGYGKILSRCLWNSKRFYANLVTMFGEKDPFVIVPFQRLPIQREKVDWTSKDVADELARLRKEIVGDPDPLTDEQLIENLKKGTDQFRDWFRSIGSDQVIVSYAFNFKVGEELNPDVHRLNAFNKAIFKKMSLLEPFGNGQREMPPLFVTSGQFDPATYGTRTVDLFKRRLGVRDDTQEPVDFLISTTMDPWLTDTKEGNIIPKLIDELGQVVRDSIAEVP